MYSTFLISTIECSSCTNQSLKSLGALRGVFGAEIDRVNGKIEVNHTDEVSRQEIADVLTSLGYRQIESEPEIGHDEPSVWGCAL